jgi:hypothetical protein
MKFINSLGAPEMLVKVMFLKRFSLPNDNDRLQGGMGKVRPVIEA